MTENTHKKIAMWSVGDDTGRSSSFLAACAIGEPNSAELAYPLDPDDFGRCYRLAKLLTTWELQHALQRAASRDAHWRTIWVNWEELCRLYEAELSKGTGTARELYKVMKKLGL